MADKVVASSPVNSQLSTRGMIWREPEIDPEAVSSFALKTGLDDILASFLVHRGVSENDVDDFLAPTLKTFCPDPSSFQDMDKATEEIAKAILDNKRVCVFADYDVDGATSAAQLNRYFRHFHRSLDLYVPDRLKEGYGPSPEAFQTIKENGVDLVITVDCGAAAVPALDHARDISLPVIVVDHHLMGEDIPDCLALVNPNRPDCQSGQGHLAAAGVVFILLISLNRYFRNRHGYAAKDLPDLVNYLDLCSLGTLCDMAPLEGVNRAFVMQGLKIIEKDDSAGLIALSQVSGRSAPRRVSDLTFGVGPQLNAGGRIGDPWLATKLLSAQDMGEAIPLAEQLNQLNEARKAVEQDILEDARRQIQRNLELGGDKKVLIAMGEGWHPGVIGIVAGRLKDEFHRPVIVIGFGEETNGLAKGSARSVAGMNIGNAIGEAARTGLLLSGGGHAMAGGLSMEPEKLASFSEFLEAYFEHHSPALEEAREIQITQDLIGSSLSMRLLGVIEKAGPYGAGAPKPLFRIKAARVEGARVIGNNHVKVQFNDGSTPFEAIAWRAADRPLGEALQKNRVVDVLGYIERNTWRGRDSVQFEIFDVM